MESYDPRTKALQIGGGNFAGEYPVMWILHKPKLIVKLLDDYLWKMSRGRQVDYELIETLRWLKEVSESNLLKPTGLCPRCGEARVERFAKVGKPTEEGGLIASCGNVICYKKFYAQAKSVDAERQEFRFSLLSNYSGENREALARLFCRAFDLGELEEVTPYDLQNLLASVPYPVPREEARDVRHR